jgi:8-oxo-dGTP pyrophosphatase MutT (NUDIX family)
MTTRPPIVWGAGADAPRGGRSATLLAGVRAEVAAHVPADPRERWSCGRTLTLLDWLPAPLDEHADPMHVTGSAIVRDERGRVLLHRHKRLGRWLQPGGHLDAGEHPAAAAVRETREETGLEAVHMAGVPRLVHVDVHEGAGGHLHLDLRYLLIAGASAVLSPDEGESSAVAWFDVAAAVALGDASVAAAIRAADAPRATDARRAPAGAGRTPK